jgi:hypothetical protein
MWFNMEDETATIHRLFFRYLGILQGSVNTVSDRLENKLLELQDILFL